MRLLPGRTLRWICLLSPRPACPAFFCLDRSRMSEALPSPPRAPFGHSASALALGLGWSRRSTWSWGARAGGKNQLLCSGETEGKLLSKACEEEGGKGAQGVTVCSFLKIFQMRYDELQLAPSDLLKGKGRLHCRSLPERSTTQMVKFPLLGASSRA